MLLFRNQNNFCNNISIFFLNTTCLPQEFQRTEVEGTWRKMVFLFTNTLLSRKKSELYFSLGSIFKKPFLIVPILNQMFRINTYLNVVMPADMLDCLVKGNNYFNKISLNLWRVSNCGRLFCTKLAILFFSLNAHMQGKGKNTLSWQLTGHSYQHTNFLRMIHKVVVPFPKHFSNLFTCNLKKIIISSF